MPAGARNIAPPLSQDVLHQGPTFADDVPVATLAELGPDVLDLLHRLLRAPDGPSLAARVPGHARS